MGWFAHPFMNPVASQTSERMVISDLKAIEQLPPAVQELLSPTLTRVGDHIDYFITS